MLYIIPTPIGSLTELSPQVRDILTEVSYIASEDPRSTQRLLTALSIHSQAKILHIHEKNEFDQIPMVISLLESDESIALMSEAGMPGLQDPGMLLIQQCAQRNIPYRVIPGPSAITTAVVAAGLPFDSFSFIGYFPKKDSEKQKILSLYRQNKGKHLLVFFESPHRIDATLSWFASSYPTAAVVICRELGKLHEEVQRGTPEELGTQKYKGEITVVIPTRSLQSVS